MCGWWRNWAARCWKCPANIGCRPEEAAKLLQAGQASGAAPCLTFHVGSQCLSPFSYAQAIEIAQRTINLSGVEIAALDIGGGFPTSYAGQEAPPYHWYFDMIKEALANLSRPDLPVMCEPGRALVAQGISLVTQVMMRRGDRVYINDGIYGSFDEQRFASFDENYPPSGIALDAKGKAKLLSGEKRPFRVYGPTCDSAGCAAASPNAARKHRQGRFHPVRRHGRLYGVVALQLQRLLSR